MIDFVATNWGNLASVLGFAVGVVTLLVARRARAAAEAALSEARSRNLVEELQEASRSVEQIGLFLRHGTWEIVWLRSQETMNACSQILARWGDDLSESSRNQVLSAKRLAASISESTGPGATPNPSDVKRIGATQVRLSQLLSAELGTSKRIVERG